VLAFAGASVAGATGGGQPASGTSLLRDPVDTNIVANVATRAARSLTSSARNSFPGRLHSARTSEWLTPVTRNAAVYWVSQGLTNFVGVNPWPVLDSAPQPLDSDGDGLPDYWEIHLEGDRRGQHEPGRAEQQSQQRRTVTRTWNITSTGCRFRIALTFSTHAGGRGPLCGRGPDGQPEFRRDPRHQRRRDPGDQRLHGHVHAHEQFNFGFASFGFSMTNLATTNVLAGDGQRHGQHYQTSSISLRSPMPCRRPTRSRPAASPIS